MRGTEEPRPQKPPGTLRRRGVMRNPEGRWLRLVACVLLLPGALARAEGVDTGDVDTGGWRFTLSPYLWGATIGASTAIDGIEPPDAGGGDYSFFTLDNLDAAAFVSFEAQKGAWAVFSDMFYISFSDRFETGPLTTDFRVHGNAQELSAVWYPPRFEHLALIAGARRISISLDVELDPGPDPSITRDWVDPIVGMRIAWPLSPRWRLFARGDVGGFGTASELTVNAVLGAGYEASERWSLLLAYRYLRVDFEDTRLVLDLAARGPGFGVQLRF